MSDLDLDAIEARAKGAKHAYMQSGYADTYFRMSEEDVPALVAEVRRLRKEVADTKAVAAYHEAYAEGIITGSPMPDWPEGVPCPNDGPRVDPTENLAPEVSDRLLVLTLEVCRLSPELLQPGLSICGEVFIDGCGMVHVLSGEIVAVEHPVWTQEEIDRAKAEGERLAGEIQWS